MGLREPYGIEPESATGIFPLLLLQLLADSVMITKKIPYSYSLPLPLTPLVHLLFATPGTRVYLFLVLLAWK